jgi:hypothetical protein
MIGRHGNNKPAGELVGSHRYSISSALTPPLPARHNCPRRWPRGRATPMSEQARRRNPTPFQRILRCYLKSCLLCQRILGSRPFFPLSLPPLLACSTLLLLLIHHFMKMPCTPPYYPSPGHESRIAHDSASSCQYYAVWQGRVRGIYTNL